MIKIVLFQSCFKTEYALPQILGRIKVTNCPGLISKSSLHSKCSSKTSAVSSIFLVNVKFFIAIIIVCVIPSPPKERVRVRAFISISQLKLKLLP